MYRRALVFGTFDPLHEGHIFVFEEARKIAERLTVIVARDSSVLHYKKRNVFLGQDERLKAVLDVTFVDEARLGDDDPERYGLLSSLDFDVLVLGYDQQPNDEDVRKILNTIDKKHVDLVRLAAYKPNMFKSSFLRS